MKYTKKEIFITALVIIFFVLTSYIANQERSFIEETIGAYTIIGPVVYVLITMVSIVFAPVNTLFLLPIAVVLWGSFTTAILSIIGWTLGSIIAFLIARKYGKPLIERFIDIEKIERFANSIPKQQNIFLVLVLARMALPVDIMSYAVGLFLPVSLRMYSLTTFIGVMPFAFIFSYAAGASLPIMIGVIIFTAVVIFSVFMWLKRTQKKL